MLKTLHSLHLISKDIVVGTQTGCMGEGFQKTYSGKIVGPTFVRAKSSSGNKNLPALKIKVLKTTSKTTKIGEVKTELLERLSKTESTLRIIN